MQRVSKQKISKKMKNKREEILAAAEEEFARNGYEGASISRIAKRVGVTHVLLYYHFKCKENLFFELLQRKIETFVQSVLPCEGDENRFFVQNIDRLITRNFDMIAENSTLARLLVNEAGPMPESLVDFAHNHFGEYLSRLQRTLDVEAEAGRIVPTNAERLMLTICSLNIMAVLVMPAIERLLPEQANEDQHTTLERRKMDNVRIVHEMLKIQE